MFNNEHMADVHFIVGPPGQVERVPAHKVSPHLPFWPFKDTKSKTEGISLFQYVLAVGSSVFCAMFYGDLAEGDSDIHIPDVEPAAFLILLK